jgi:hypothetical protein
MQSSSSKQYKGSHCTAEEKKGKLLKIATGPKKGRVSEYQSSYFQHHKVPTYKSTHTTPATNIIWAPGSIKIT